MEGGILFPGKLEDGRDGLRLQESVEMEEGD